MTLKKETGNGRKLSGKSGKKKTRRSQNIIFKLRQKKVQEDKQVVSVKLVTYLR